MQKIAAPMREPFAFLWWCILAFVGLVFALVVVFVASIAFIAIIGSVKWFSSILDIPSKILAKGTLENFGQFGDSFGVVTSVATVIALVLLFQTYRFQKRELVDMQKFMKQQTNWNVVLQLCEQYREMMAQITANPQGGWIHSPKPENTHGKNGLREVISHILARADEITAESWKQRTGFLSLGVEDIILADKFSESSVAEKAFSSHEGCFRLLHRIFKYIDELECSEEEKQRYARIPRSMLSNIEMEALLINCLTKRGSGMKDYVQRYTVLNNYAPVILDDTMAYEFCSAKRYKRCAFGDNLWLKSGRNLPA